MIDVASTFSKTSFSELQVKYFYGGVDLNVSTTDIGVAAHEST